MFRVAKVDTKDIDGYTPLLTAAEFGRQGCFNILLKYGASMEEQTRDRKNVLFLAAESDHPEIVEVS